MSFQQLGAAKILLGIFFLTTTAFGQSLPTDPNKTWRVLETEHFDIIYDEPQKLLAEKFAAEAERAHQLLQPFLKISVPRHVPVVLADITDSTNGSATGVPRSQIEIYPVLPAVEDSISEYADWHREVITHEYTHILTFEPTSDFMAVLRFVYGSFVKPNTFLPRWYTEGLAVEMESRLTPVGRGRSHYYSALVRSFVEDKTWGDETFAQINMTEIPTWPRGSRPYTYGYFLMHELSELDRAKNSDAAKPEYAGPMIYGLLDDRFGGRVPWFINGPVEDYFDSRWGGLLAKTYSRLRVKADKQLSTLEKGGAVNGEAIDVPGYFILGAQISPDGLKIAAIVSDFDNDPAVQVWKRAKPTDKFVFDKHDPVKTNKDIHQISWRADSQHLVYDHSGTWKHFSNFSDLYDLDTKTGKETRLTHGLRAREATVLPSGKLAFMVASSSNTQLWTSDGDGNNAALKFSPPYGHRLSTPRPFKDGVIYSHRDDKGHEWIESFHFNNQAPIQLTKVTRTDQMHIWPFEDPQHKGQFYFSGSDSGVFNIYHGDSETRRAVTNVTTYAMSPTVDSARGELIYSRLTSDGFRLEKSKLSDKTQPPQTISEMQTYPPAQTDAAPPAKILDEHSYQGAGYLFPQYWIPFIYFVPDGAIFDATFESSDPLYHHQYYLDLGYDTRAGQPTEIFSYTNGSLPFLIDTSVANTYNFIVGSNTVYHYAYGLIDTRHFLTPNENKWVFSPEVTYSKTDYAGSVFTQAGPGASISYDNVTPERDYQISPEKGQSFLLGYDYFLSQWGNTSFPAVRGQASQYLAGGILPKHNVISLKTSFWISPAQATILTGTQQAGGEYFGSLFSNPYLVRGYPIGEFIASSLYIGNLEYRFPISYPYSGSATPPLFSNKWSGALVCDGITLDGGYYDSTIPIGQNNLLATRTGVYYVGAGAELRGELQILYSVPLTLRVGYYNGFTQNAFGGPTYYLGFGLVQ